MKELLISIGPYSHLPVLVVLGLLVGGVENKYARWVLALIACLFVAIMQTLLQWGKK